MNEAQKLLIRIGGTAELVAGAGDHWWADSQTAKKPRQRLGRIGRGSYVRNLMAHFDTRRFDAINADKLLRAMAGG